MLFFTIYQIHVTYFAILTQFLRLFSLEEETSRGGLTTSPNSTLTAPTHPTNYQPSHRPVNPFEDPSSLEQYVPFSFDRNLSPLPGQEFGRSNFPNQETDPSFFPKQEFETSLFSNVDFQAAGTSFMEQLDGDEDVLKRKNSVIPEREIVEISPSSLDGHQEPGDFTTYFGVRSNDLGNLTQPITPNSRPRFSNTTPTMSSAKKQLFSNSPTTIRRVGNEQTIPDRDMTPFTDYSSPDLIDDGQHPGQLLNKSNDLLKKVTSLLECRKFNADEFIKTLESEMQQPIPSRHALPTSQHIHPTHTPPTKPGYELDPENYLTPQPFTPIQGSHVYPTGTSSRDITLPAAYLLPNVSNPHSIAPTNYLLPTLSGDSLDSCDVRDMTDFSSMPRQHSLPTSLDDTDNDVMTPQNDLTIRHNYTQSADNINSLRDNSQSNSPTLQHSMLTNSADDLRELQLRRRNLSNTSACYSLPEGLDTLTTLPPLPSPPTVHVRTRRASREELAPKELTVDIELEETTALNCCIGGINHGFLKLYNRSPCWVQTQLEFKSVKFGSDPIDTQSEMMPFSMYNRCILGTAKSEQVKISFAPSGCPGVYTVDLDVYISKIVDSSIAKPSKTFSFTAEAIRPEISVLYQKESSKLLDFGFVTEGKSYEQNFTLVNKSNCSLPIKISFPVKRSTSTDLSLSLTSQRDKNPDVQRENSISTILEPRGEGVRGKMDLWVWFKPSYHLQTGVGTKSPALPGEMNSLIEIFLDGPFASSSSKLINSIPVTANFAESDLVILESIDTLRFETSVSRSLTRSFTLHNRGSIPITLTMEIDPPSTDFMIAPYHISLQPAQQSPASLSYRPSKHESTYTGILHILYNPGGKRQTLKVLAREEPPDSPPIFSQEFNFPPAETITPAPSGENYLLSNILSLNWGAQQLEECVERKIVLFNTSEQDLKLSVDLKSKFFFIKDKNEKFTSNLNMSIPTRVKLAISLAFAPIDCQVYNANLSITDLSHSKVFQIPLTGYGGRSQILIVNAERTSDGYWMNIGEIKKLERNVFKVYLLNNGVRKAYIKAVCKDNKPTKPILTPPQVTITPSEFIIFPQDYKSILVTFTPRPDHVSLCELSPQCLAYVSLTTCDCMTAKIYFSQLRAKNLQIPPPLEYLHKLFSLDISEDEDYSQFQLSTHLPSPPVETEVSVPMIGYPPTVSRPLRPSSVPVTRSLSHEDSPIGTPIFHQSPELTPPLRKKNSERTSARSSPVNGIGSPKLRRKPIHSPSRYSPKPTPAAFTVYPSQLSLSSESREPAKLYIHSLSQTTAKFAVVFPKQFVTVSPARGTIDPGEEKKLLVSSLLADMTDLPSSLTEYLTIHYEDSVKSVPLNILMEPASPATPVRESFTSVTKYLSPPNILFSPIKSNSVSDLPITITNPHSFPIHWSLASMGQAAFQEGEGSSLEILKTNYAVFFFHRLSGGLASNGTSSISVTFQPRRSGTYTQTWEMQLTKGVKMIDSIKLSVSGKMEDSVMSKPSSPLPSRETHPANKPPRRRVYLEPDIVNYPQTRPHTSNTLKVSVFNKSDVSLKFSVNELTIPFSIHKQHTMFVLEPRHCAKLPIVFNPVTQGYFEEVLALKSSDGKKLHALLKGESSFYPRL